MRGTDVRRGLLFLLVFGLLPIHAGAQETFEKLAGKIREGQKIIVRDATGAEIRGIVQSLGRSSLVVNYGQERGDTRSFAPGDVRLVLKPGPIWDGAVKGALVALAGVLLVEAQGCYACGQAEFNAVAVGAAIGLGIDAAWGPKTVYRNPAAIRRMTLAPILGKERRGLAASIRF